MNSSNKLDTFNNIGFQSDENQFSISSITTDMKNLYFSTNKTFKTFVGSALLLVIMLSGTSATACTLTNPGFESNFSGWWNSNTSLVTISTDAFAGSKSANLTGQSGVSQGISGVSAGQTLTLSARYKNVSSSWFDVQIEFKNASWGVISTHRAVVTHTSAWALASVTATAPAGTANVTIWIGRGGSSGYSRVDDVCVVTGGGGGSTAITPPPAPSCSNGTYNNVWTWQGTDFGPRMGTWGGGVTQYSITSGIPIAVQSGAVNIELDNVITWDGYEGRQSVTQSYERVKFIFRKNGNTVWQTGYTQDLADNVVSAHRISDLGSTSLTNGFDQIIVVHYEDSSLGEGDQATQNSLQVPSFCLRYSTSTPPPPTNTEFSYSCSDNVFVGVLGQGAICSNNPDARVTIPNPSNVFQVVAEVVYKNQYPGSSITIQSNTGASYTLPQVNISGTSSSVYVYRATISANPSYLQHNSQTSNCGDSNGFQSLVVYPFYNNATSTTSSGRFTEQSGYCDLQTFTLPIPASTSGARDVVVTVPISELTNDGRFLTLRGNAGGVTAQTTIFGPNTAGGQCCLNLVTLSFNNVPAGTTSINIEVDTRSSSNPSGSWCGQSWVIAGLVHAEIECVCPNITLNVTKNNTTCGLNNGSATASASGGQSPYTYTWSGGLGAGATKNNLAAGTYTVTVTDANGCTATRSVTINSSTSPSVTTGPDVEICSGSNVTIMASASNGTSPYTYAWNQGLGAGASKTVSPTSTTTYTVTVTDANGCTATDQIVVNVNPLPVANAGADRTICIGSSTNLAASATSGTAPYSYVWNQSLGAGANKTVSPSATTTYTVTVVDSKGCADTDQVVVTVRPNPTVSIAKTDATCGSNNGTATASATGGTAPYTYAWSNGLGAGATKTGLAAGTYTVTVTDANGCTGTGSVTINNVGGPTANAGPDQAICAGASATLTATRTGGTAPFTFSWSNGLGNGATKTVTPSATTTYTVTVTDANGCTSTDQVVVTVRPNPTVTFTKVDATCGNSNGSATASGAGGTAPYTYAWSNGLGAGATKTGLAAGTYTVTVTDANGCTGTGSVTINNVGGPTANAGPDQAICAGASTLHDGSRTGGCFAFFSWSNG
ncbi:MAG: hypothetical protein R2795_05655 [Saprospiraceae bacterium]